MNQTRQLQKLEEKIRKEKNKKLKYTYLHQLADTSRKEGRLAYALQIYEDALVVAQNISDSKRACETLFYLGLTADELGDTKDAINYYTRALDVADSTEDFKMKRRINGKLGVLYAKEGNAILTAEYFTHANDATRMIKWKTVRVSEEKAPPNALATLEEKTRSRRATQPPEAHAFATLRNEINQENLTKVIEQIILVVFSVLCFAFLIIIGKDILSLSPIYLLTGVIIISLLGVLYSNAYRSK